MNIYYLLRLLLSINGHALELKLGAHYPGRPASGPGRPGVKRPVCTGHPDVRAGRPKKLVVQCFFSVRAGRPGSVNRA